ncbi:retrovirus-related pol polyprotein from transposon TNT 1-94 [Tanacetum coccineum]
MEQAVEQHHIVNTIVNSSVDITPVNVNECKKCLKLKTELLNKMDFIEKEIYDKLFKSFTTLEKHCISLEVDSQLNQEIFQRNNFVSNQSASSFDQLFELNELKAQSQEKDTVIKKLKERIKSLSGKMNKDKIKKDLEEIETINIELDRRVSKLIAENEHLKQTYKQLYDSIKPARIRSKEQYLKDDLRKLKRKALVDNDVTKHPSDPEMLKIDVEPIIPKLYAKLIQEWLTHISKTCPSVNNTDRKLVVVTPKNKDKRVRFTKPVTSSGYTITKTASTSNLVSNKPMLSSTGVKPSTSASGSQPSGNTKKDKIRQTPSSTQKNKVEAHPRKVKSSLKNKDCVVQPKGTAHVQHSKLNANSELKCVNVNEKKYILVIVGDYSRFTWVKCLKSKDEAPYFIIKFLKMIQVRLKVPVRRIKTDNGTEFVNQTLREYYEKVGISHETSVARSPQQNGVVERQNRTLIEAACQVDFAKKARYLLWAERLLPLLHPKSFIMTS